MLIPVVPIDRLVAEYGERLVGVVGVRVFCVLRMVPIGGLFVPLIFDVSFGTSADARGNLSANSCCRVLCRRCERVALCGAVEGEAVVVLGEGRRTVRVAEGFVPVAPMPVLPILRVRDVKVIAGGLVPLIVERTEERVWSLMKSSTNCPSTVGVTSA